jgi:heme o synthase
MMPVIAGQRETKKQMLAYTILLWPLSVAPTLIGVAGALYGAAALALSALFTLAAIRVWRDDGERSAKQMFAFSILYLFLLFAFLVIDRAPGLAGGLG